MVFTISFQSLSASTLLKGQINNIDENISGLNIKLIPETLIDTELSLKGDLFSAYLSNPSAALLQVPKGSKLQGKISEVKKAASFNRSGKVKAHINQLILPDGSTVKVSADLSSKASLQDKEDPKHIKDLASSIGSGMANLSASTMVGAVDSIQYLGLGTAIASSGISVAAGAAIGLGTGIVGAIAGRGNELISTGFDPVNFKLDSDFVFLEKIPLQGQQLKTIAASSLGVYLNVLNIEKYYSKSYGEFLLFDISVQNSGTRKINSADFVLVSNTRIRPIFSNPLLTGELYANLTKNQKGNMILAYSIGNIKKNDNYQLMLLNPITQEVIANLEVDFTNYL